MKTTSNSAKVLFCLTMLTFGTVGVIRVNLPFPSSFIALARAAIASVVIAAVLLVKREKTDKSTFKRALPLLCVLGVLLGANWITLFEAYRYTSVATATLCYYTAPVFVILLSPLVLKERLTVLKLLCAFVALVGMFLVSGVAVGEKVDAVGLAYALGAAMIYAAIVLINKRIAQIPPLTKTLVQMCAATVTLLPYTLFTEDLSALVFTPMSVGLLLVLGAVHTGVAYVLYFGTMSRLPAQSVALFSYIDPASAVVFSAVILGEALTFSTICGAVLIIGATLVNELAESKKH